MEMQKLRKEIADAERMYDQIVSGISTKLNLDKMEGYKPKPTSGSKGKSSDPAWLVEYKQKRADLDHRLAMDKVTEKQYYDGVEKLNDDYLKAHKKTHLDMYRKNVEEIYKGRNKLDQDKISKSLNKLKYRLGMDEITEEQYYDQLEKLNEKYLKKYKSKYLDQYEKIVEEIYKGKKKLEEEKFEKFLANIDVSLSEVDRYLKFVDKGSIEELTLLQTGFNEATKNADELNRRIKELNKQYSKGKISQETYTDRLDKLNSKLFSSADAMRSYRDSIVNYMKSVYDEQLKTLETDQKDALESLEENHKDILDSLDKQLDRYKEIVNQQKESLRQKQKERDYQKDVEKQTSNISKIEKRITDLSKAARSGDREAIAEMQKLEEQLAEAKEKLDDTQYDRQVELSEEALDKSYDYYEKMIKDQINTQKSLYDSEKLQIESNFQTKMNNINKLYENEMELIIKAADLTKSSFSELLIQLTLLSHPMV